MRQKGRDEARRGHMTHGQNRGNFPLVAQSGEKLKKNRPSDCLTSLNVDVTKAENCCWGAKGQRTNAERAG